jgi:RecA-family ATPase
VTPPNVVAISGSDPPVLDPESLNFRSRIPFAWASRITADLSELTEIVEGVFTAGGLSIVYGESNSGKSTLMLDLAFRMPSGLPWMGRRTMKGAVVYVALEGAASVRRRLEAYRRHHDCRVYAFGLIPCTLNLLDPSADVEDVVDLILGLEHELLDPVRLVVIDTLARAMAGADENAGQDMGRLVSAGDRIREATGAHVAFVHHAGKDAARGARGHSSLRGAVDTELEVTADAGAKTHTVTVSKQRDLASKGESFSARFRAVELGTNQWGNPVTACVVEPIEAAGAHVLAVMRQVDDRHAEDIAIAGFKSLQTMGIDATDAKNSANYLPRQMAEKALSKGVERDALAAALNRLMARGVFKRGTVGAYENRTTKTGLVLIEGGK